MSSAALDDPRRGWGPQALAPPLFDTASALDDLPWASQSGPLEALGLRFEVRSTDPVLGRYLEHTLAVFASDCLPARRYSIAHHVEGTVPWWAAWFGNERIIYTTAPTDVLTQVLWHINRAVVDDTPDKVLVHAAGAVWRSAGVVLPAAMESGKTTTVAGLVQRGMSYLTDEIVALDPETLRISAYPKPLSVDPGSWQVLADLEPVVDEATRPYLSGQWHVSVPDIRSDAVVRHAEPRFVLAPRYVAGAWTTLVQQRRSKMLAAIMGNLFRPDDGVAEQFEVLSELLRTCECYDLTIGDLDEACRLVFDLVGSD